MTNIAVVYCSRYGSTKQYAQWLAEDLGADLYDVRRVYKEKLETYDTIVFGGGLYYGVIKGLSRLKRNYASIRESNLVVFAVGFRRRIKSFWTTWRKATFLLPCGRKQDSFIW